jgi:glycosyltransferase involved in cell wall biosynthesis
MEKHLEKSKQNARIVTILPVSRLDFLDRVLESLLNQSYKPHTSLLVVVDGSDDLFLKVRNKVAQIGLEEVLCVQSNNPEIAPEFVIPQRRTRIANVHNQISGLLTDDVDYVFSIEDDGILPMNALSWLVNDMENYRSAGLVTGVELGRWGVPYVGAWNADDIMNPQKIVSAASKVGSSDVDEIDACGLYCALIRADLYKQHVFTAENGLGPDVNMALEFKQLGFKNYIDWFVPVTHITKRNLQVTEIPATTEAKIVTLTPLGEAQLWHASY